MGKSLFANFIGFARHYATEANAVAASLSTILDALPIQHADKAKVRELIERIELGATNIGEFLATNPTEASVKISAKDIKAAFADYAKSDDGRATFDVRAAVAEFFRSDEGVAVLADAVAATSQTPAPVSTETGTGTDA